jgi:hypothetical protein
LSSKNDSMHTFYTLSNVKNCIYIQTLK